MRVTEKDGIKHVSCKEEKEALAVIREELNTTGRVEVCNLYETFYGVGFDGWLRNGIKDIPCDIEVKTYNQWEGYPWDYVITKK